MHAAAKASYTRCHGPRSVFAEPTLSNGRKHRVCKLGQQSILAHAYRVRYRCHSVQFDMWASASEPPLSWRGSVTTVLMHEGHNKIGQLGVSNAQNNALTACYFGYEIHVEAHSHLPDPCSHLQQRAKRHQHPSLKTPYAHLTQLGEGCAN